jgi:dephospho-CoA kinase
MLRVGITGGIGSGKSIVCQVFATLGIPVFNADNTARHLMEHDAALVHGISSLLGADVYDNGLLNRAKVSSIIFKDPAKLEQLNALVHPATIQYAKDWFNSQSAPYVIKEAAIFFESGSNVDMDVMVGIFAPEELRIQRTIDRSKLTRAQVVDIISRQMNEDEKMKRCDYVITNDDLSAVLPQVLQLHTTLLARASSKG